MANLPTYPLTVDGVEHAIAAIPGTSEDIAEWLATHDIRGVLDNACGCPLAVYFHRVLPAADYVQVDGTDVLIIGTYIDDLGLGEGFRYHPDLPGGAAWFTEDFDNNVYPELVREVTPHADPAA